MAYQTPIRARQPSGLDHQPERDEGVRAPRGGFDRGRTGVAPPRRADRHLTSRDLMTAVRERLAAEGFDWGEALTTGRVMSSAGREEPR